MGKRLRTSTTRRMGLAAVIGGLTAAMVAPPAMATDADGEGVRVGDAVFADVNGNGRHDEGEPGVSEVAVVLRDADGARVDRTTTDTEGAYLFESVEPGRYTLEVPTLPEGFVPNDDLIDPRSPGDPEAVLEITVRARDLSTADLALTPAPSAVRGTATDADDSPLAGVAVVLEGTDVVGTEVREETTTDTRGTYTFADVRAGTYEVTADGTEPVAVTVAPGRSLTDVRLAAPKAPTRSSLAGSVWHDQNGDGVRQRREPGIEAVKITLRGTDIDSETVRRTATTDSDGDFLFDELAAGTYTLVETQPDAYLDGAEIPGSGGGAVNDDRFIDIVVPPREDVVGYLFGEEGNVVTGTVWLDTDGDGTRDGGEAGRLGGVDLDLLDGDTVVESTTSSSDGTYAFASVPTGNYRVAQTQPTGYATTTPNRVAVSVPSGGVSGLDFGEQGASVSGLAWDDDTLADGLRGTNETTINGVTFELLDADGTVVASAITGNDGSYAFTDLAAGTWTVRTAPLQGDVLTRSDVGTDVRVDSDFPAGTRSLSVDLGVAQQLDHVDAGFVTARPDLSVTLTVNDTTPNAGDDLTYTAVATNVGNTVLTGGVVATFTLPANLRYLQENSDVWSCTAGPPLVCRMSQDVAPGAAAPALAILVDVVSLVDSTTTVAVAAQDGSVDVTPATNTASVRIAPPGATPPPGSTPTPGTPGGGGLPATGTESGRLALFGGVLVALGALFVLGSRVPRLQRAEVRTED